MKKPILLSLVVFLFSCQAKTPSPSIVGTWELVSFKIINNGNTTLNSPDNGTIEQLKSWSEKSFVFAGKTENNKKVNYSFGNGSYTLKGNHYTEIIKAHISPSFEGKTVRLHLEMSGDTLTQIFPVKNDWSYDTENCWIEKYIRTD